MGMQQDNPSRAFLIAAAAKLQAAGVGCVADEQGFQRFPDAGPTRDCAVACSALNSLFANCVRHAGPDDGLDHPAPFQLHGGGAVSAVNPAARTASRLTKSPSAVFVNATCALAERTCRSLVAIFAVTVALESLSVRSTGCSSGSSAKLARRRALFGCNPTAHQDLSMMTKPRLAPTPFG